MTNEGGDIFLGRGSLCGMKVGMHAAFSSKG